MNIKVVPRAFFTRIQGTPEEETVLSQHRIISINSSNEPLPPFSKQFFNLPTLLILRFDDVSNPKTETGVFMIEAEAKRIVDFALNVSPDKPLIVHCTAGICRSGAVGQVLNDYVNRHLHKNDEDYCRFIREHFHIQPNVHVRRLLLEEIDRRIKEEIS